MTTPYRNDEDALKERLVRLEADLAATTARAAELESMRATEGALRREIAEIRARLTGSGGRRVSLEVVRVASPCPAKWSEMTGDEQVRHCAQCDKQVFDLSAMTRDEAERFVGERATDARPACIRIHRRADGRVITSDCPVGVRRRSRRRIAAVAAVVGGSLVLGGGAAFGAAQTVTMGDMAPLPDEQVMVGVMAVVEPTAAPSVTPSVVPSVAPSAAPTTTIGKPVSRPAF